MLPHLERRYRETDSNRIRDDLARFMNTQPCPACNGARLGPPPWRSGWAGISIFEFTRMPCARRWSSCGSSSWASARCLIADKVLKEIAQRLGFMADVGLDYLTLERTSATLSGGEGQRIRLATQIGSALVGVLYVLDEPSIGLHQRDNRRLLNTLMRMRDLGNTVLVVEHDEDTILKRGHGDRHGPGRGPPRRRGGVRRPARPLLKSHRKSLTGQYLSGKKFIPVPEKRRKQRPGLHRADRLHRAQPQEHRRGRSPGPVHLRDRRVRLGQVHPGHRHPVPGPGPAALPLQGAGRRGARDKGPEPSWTR